MEVQIPHLTLVDTLVGDRGASLLLGKGGSSGFPLDLHQHLPAWKERDTSLLLPVWSSLTCYCWGMVTVLTRPPLIPIQNGGEGILLLPGGYEGPSSPLILLCNHPWRWGMGHWLQPSPAVYSAPARGGGGGLPRVAIFLMVFG